MKKRIKETALKMIKSHGLINLSVDSLCIRAGIHPGSFAHVMGCTFREFVNTLVDDDDIIRNVTKCRVDPKLRRKQIFNAAIELAEKHGYTHITRDMVARHANVSAGLVAKHFNTMGQLRTAIIRAAIKRQILPIIAQGLINHEPHVIKAPFDLKKRAASSIGE